MTIEKLISIGLEDVTRVTFVCKDKKCGARVTIPITERMDALQVPSMFQTVSRPWRRGETWRD